MEHRPYRMLPAAGAFAAFATPVLADSGFGHGGGMMWGMGAMGIHWIVALVVLVLGIFALIKYLR